jgi:hypothetical protein
VDEMPDVICPLSPISTPAASPLVRRAIILKKSAQNNPEVRHFFRASFL